MDNIRRAVATFSIVAILSSFVVSTAMAGSFSDVPAGAWYEDEVEALVDLDVVDATSDTYDPAGPLTRGYAAKYVILGAGWQLATPEAATFTDVGTDHWAFSYIETAVSHEFMGGYAHKPGYFGPEDTVTREQYAKMAVNSFELPLYTPAEPTFSDVTTDMWSYEFVETAAHYGVVEGYADGTFKPTATINRAEGAAMTYRGTTAEAGAEGEGEGEGEGETEEPGGGLEISISDDTPEGGVVPSGASGVPMLMIDLEANDGDVELDGLTLKQTGVVTLPTTFQLYLYEGSNRLTSAKAVNSSTSLAEFKNLGIEVEDGETVTLTVKADIGTVGNTNLGTVSLDVVDETYVDSDSEEVSGLPVGSESFSLSTAAAGTVTVTKNGSVTNAKVGEDDVTIGKFKMAIAGEAANVEEIAIYLAGTIDTGAVENLELYVAGEDDALATVDGVNGKDLAVFTFDDPYFIEKGATKSFTVKGDLNTGRSGDTLQLYFDESTDIVSIGDKYGYGMGVTITSFDGTSCASGSTECNFMTLQGGDITITSSGPTAGTVGINSNDVVLMNFSITSVTDATFKNFPIMMTTNTPTGNDGLVDSSTANFTDIKIVNVDTGKTLEGPIDSTSLTTALAGATAVADGTDETGYYLFTDDFSMDAGEELNLALTVDVRNSSVLNNTTITGSLNLGASYPELRDVNNKVLTNADVLVPASTITGKTMTVASPSLTLSLASTPASKTYVKGEKGIPFTGVTFACGSASDCEVTDITVTGYLDDNGSTGGASFSSTGTGAAHSTSLSTYTGSVWLEDPDGELIAAAESMSSGTAVFDDVNWPLDAGEVAVAYVVGDLSSNSYANSDAEYIGFGIAAATDVSYEDDDGTTRNATGTVNTTPSTYVTTANGGTLTVAIDSATAKEDIIVAGTTGVEIAKYKFTTTREAYKIQKLSVNNRQSGVTDALLGDYDDNISKITVSYTNSDGDTETKNGYLNNGTAIFSGLDMLVAADSDAVMTVYADVNTISVGSDAATFIDLAPAFNNFEAVAQSSGGTYTVADLDATTVATGAYLDVGTISYTSGGSLELDSALSTVTVGGSVTLDVDNAGVAPSNVLPVGTFVCIDDGDSGTCSSENILVVTSVTQDESAGAEDEYTFTVVDDAGGVDDVANDDILYALPGSGYLTATNHMYVYEAKPEVTLASTSPSGTRTVAASDNVFVFKIEEKGGQEKLQFRSSVDFTTCVIGTANGTLAITNAAQALVTVDGAACELSNPVTDDDVVYYANTADLSTYSYVSFWFRWHDDSAALATLYPTELYVATDVDKDAADNTQAVAVANVAGAPTYFIEDTWYHVRDVAMPTNTDSGDLFIGVGIDETDVTFAAADDIFIDRFRVYNEKIEIDLASDADFDRTYDQSTTAAKTPTIAYLKDGGTTVATGYIDTLGVAAAVDGVEDTDGSTASVMFVPTSAQGNLEISKGSSKTLTLQTNTSNLLGEDAGSDDPLTISIDLGTSSGGSPTAGNIFWYETNATATWLGSVDDTTLNGNALKY